MSEYPEHQKLQNLNGDNEKIGAFLEWLRGQGIELCVWREEGNNGEPREVDCTREEWEANRYHTAYSFKGYDDNGNGIFKKDNPDYEYWGEGHVPAYWVNRNMQRIEDVIATYFKIDQKKLEAEKRAMLDAWYAVIQ